MIVRFHSLRLPLLFILLTGPLALQLQAEEVSFFHNIHIKQGTVSSDAVCIGCSILVDGQLNADAVAIAGDVVVSGVVEGDAIAVGGGVRTQSAARLAGDAIAVGGSADIAAGTVEAEVTAVPYFFLPGQRSLYLIGTVVFVGVNISILMLGGLLLRSRLKQMASPIKGRPLLTVLAGLVLIILFGLLEDNIPDSSFGEVVTDIMGILFCLALLAGYSALSWQIGSLMLPGRRLWVVLLAGATASTLLLMIPVFGLLALVVVPVLSIGCLLLSGLGCDSDWFVARVLKRRSESSPG